MKTVKCLMLMGLFATFSSVAFAKQPFVGLSAFAAFNDNFPCDRYLQAMKGVQKPAMAVLWHSFADMAARGDQLYRKDSCPERFLRKYGKNGKKHLLQIFLANTYCLRNSSCRKFEIFGARSTHLVNSILTNPGHPEYGETVANIKGKTKQVSDWLNEVKANEATDTSQDASLGKRKTRRKILLTLGLEDDLSQSAMEAFYDIVTTYLDELDQNRIKIGRNPVVSHSNPNEAEVVLTSSQRIDREKIYYELHPSKQPPANRQTNFFRSADFAYWDSNMGFSGHKCVANLDGVSVWTNPDESNQPKIYDDESKFHQRSNGNIDLQSAKEFVDNHRKCFAVFLWYSPLQGYYTDQDNIPQNPRNRQFRLSAHAAVALNDVMKNWPHARDADQKVRVNHYQAKIGLYQVRSLHADKCMDVQGASMADTSMVQQWECLGDIQANQGWYFQPVDDTYYQIVARHSGKCLDVAHFAYNDTAPVQQYECLGPHQDNQLWRLNYIGDGVQVIAKHSGKCLDVLGVSYENGAPLQQYTCLGAHQPNQIWQLHEFHNYRTALKTYWGSYVIAHPDDHVYGNAPHAYQWETWEMVDLGNEQYALKSYHGLYLTALPDGIVLAQGTWLGPWERFTLVKLNDNKFGLRSVHGGYLIVHPDGYMVANSPHLLEWETFSFAPLFY